MAVPANQVGCVPTGELRFCCAHPGGKIVLKGSLMTGVVNPVVGVMVNVTVTGALVVLVNIPLILPEPFAGIPVTVVVLFLVQV